MSYVIPRKHGSLYYERQRLLKKKLGSFVDRQRLIYLEMSVFHNHCQNITFKSSHLLVTSLYYEPKKFL